jgi:hypothetical protein
MFAAYEQSTVREIEAAKSAMQSKAQDIENVSN